VTTAMAIAPATACRRALRGQAAVIAPECLALGLRVAWRGLPKGGSFGISSAPGSPVAEQSFGDSESTVERGSLLPIVSKGVRESRSGRDDRSDGPHASPEVVEVTRFAPLVFLAGVVREPAGNLGDGEPAGWGYDFLFPVTLDRERDSRFEAGPLPIVRSACCHGNRSRARPGGLRRGRAARRDLACHVEAPEDADLEAEMLAERADVLRARRAVPAVPRGVPVEAEPLEEGAVSVRRETPGRSTVRCAEADSAGKEFAFEALSAHVNAPCTTLPAARLFTKSAS
jgi:hypothetical protein